MTTKAMAEGAIEGVAADYRMGSKYATDFKYSRFDASSAQHRDVASLTKVAREQEHSNGKLKNYVKSCAHAADPIYIYIYMMVLQKTL